MLPLKDIIILDLTINGGYCGMELADYGAQVIKIEVPGLGDPLRELAPTYGGASPHHIFRDRGKQSLTLDITTEEGKEIFKKLVKKADGLIENFPPGTMEALGLAYEELEKLNPKLVYGRTTSYGYEGVERDLPQLDLIAQAKTGVMHFTGFPENPPTRIGFYISEHYSSSFLSAAMCIAIFHARETGEGQLVETSLCGSVIAISEDKVITYGATDEDPMRTGNAHPLINPYDILKCSDGFVAMGISSDAQWAKFCDAFNMPQWNTDPLYCSNAVRGLHYFGDLRVKIEELFSNYTMAEIAKICDEALIPGTMCSTTKEALEEPQLHARNMLMKVDIGQSKEVVMPGRPVKFFDMDDSPFKPAPTLGQHTHQILNELGIETEQQNTLKMKGII